MLKVEKIHLFSELKNTENSIKNQEDESIEYSNVNWHEYLSFPMHKLQRVFNRRCCFVTGSVIDYQ